jgi:hypothetical protein
VELIPIEVPETPKAPAAAQQGPDLAWHEQQEMMRVQHMQQQQQQMVMHSHPGQQGRMQQQHQQQQHPHSMMQQQQQHGMYDQQAMYGAPAGMGPGVLLVSGGGMEGSCLGPGMVPVGFDGGLQQQQQRKRSGNSSELEGLKPTKSFKVRPA